MKNMAAQRPDSAPPPRAPRMSDNHPPSEPSLKDRAKQLAKQVLDALERLVPVPEPELIPIPIPRRRPRR